jgi:glycosyltransferase involved in cell wall biosynthesis
MTPPLITVCTPTYNRGILLKRCYESLLAQDSKNFIWQIIDDGSIDETSTLVENWVTEGKLKIEYYYKPNGGKASALNFSFSKTKSELWLCLDSDDYFSSFAISLISSQYDSIKDESSVCGFFSLRASPNGLAMQGKQIPENIDYISQSKVRYEYHIPPEYAHVFKTKIISDFKYPEIPGEKYFPLSYIFDQIDQRYVYKVVHECFMVCDYQDSGITRNKRLLIEKNPKGYMRYKNQLMGLAPSRRERFKAAANYVTGCILDKRYNFFFDVDNKVLIFWAIPVGCLDYLIRYKLKLDINFE